MVDYVFRAHTPTGLFEDGPTPLSGAAVEKYQKSTFAAVKVLRQ